MREWLAGRLFANDEIGFFLTLGTLPIKGLAIPGHLLDLLDIVPSYVLGLFALGLFCFFLTYSA